MANIFELADNTPELGTAIIKVIGVGGGVKGIGGHFGQAGCKWKAVGGAKHMDMGITGFGRQWPTWL